MKNFIINLTIIICCFSCTDNKFVSDKEWDSKIEYSHVKIIGELPINISREIFVVDSLIIISDPFSQPVYNIFKITEEETIEYVFGFGTRGQGPNEFLDNLGIKIIGNDTLTIFNTSLLRNYLIAKSSLLDDTVSIITENLPNASGFSNNFIKLDNNLYFGNGTFEKGMFAFYRDGSKIYPTIPYHDDGIAAANMQKNMVYEGDMLKQPNGNKLAYAAFYGHIFEIYEITQDTMIKKIFSDIYEYPKYEPVNTQNYYIDNCTKDNKHGFFTLSATNEYIYALYCGKTSTEKNPFSANIIYVYDWDGNKIKKFIIDKEIVGMCSNSQNSRIYSLYEDVEDDILKVVCFDLKLP